MPKELSHILIAQDVLAELKGSGRRRLARILEKNLSAFYLGAIIPDAFFYDATPFLGLSKNNVQIARALHLKETAENDARAVGFFDAIAVDPHAWPSKVAFAAGILIYEYGIKPSATDCLKVRIKQLEERVEKLDLEK